MPIVDAAYLSGLNAVAVAVLMLPGREGHGQAMFNIGVLLDDRDVAEAER